MTPRLRQATLTAHVVLSVGWLGSVAGFLALSVAGVTSRDPDVVRGAYLSMDLIGRFVIVPASLAALASGLVQALGTEWGLVRYYWVFVKLVLSVLATIGLVLHQLTAVAGAARQASRASPGAMPDVGRLGVQLVADAGLALLLLGVITTISVFKPWGKTRREERPAGGGGEMRRSLKLALAVAGLLLAGFVLLHLAGGGLGHHGR